MAQSLFHFKVYNYTFMAYLSLIAISRHNYINREVASYLN